MGPKFDLKWKTNAVLVMAALWLAACGQSQPNNPAAPANGNSNQSPATKTNAGSQSTAAPVPPEGDARQNLIDAYRRLKTAYPYRLTETSGGAANNQAAVPETVRVVEFAAADRVHAKMGGVETITIGDKTYWNYGGKWAETGKPPKATEADMERLIAGLLKDVQFAGTETVNGVPCFTYTLRYEGSWSGQPASGNGKTWIGAADGLPHQADSELKVSSYGMKSHLVYEYNVDIKVERPVP